MQTLTRQRKVNPAQARFLSSNALYRGYVGGRGAGKSWIGAYDMLVRAKPGRTYLIASPTGVLLHDTTFPTLRALAQETGLWGPVTIEELPEIVFSPTGDSKVKMTPYPTVQLSSGATIRFRTAEDPEKMRGPNLSGCWLDEASLMPHEAYLIAIAALREAGEQGWLTATFTPKGFGHWTYETFGKQKPNTAIFHSKTKENAFLPPGFQEQLEEQYGNRGLLAQQELGGEFVSVEGAEWPPEYFGSGIWFDDWPTNWTIRTTALDPSKGSESKSGDYSAFVLLGRTVDGMLWCEGDLNQQRTAETIIEDAIEIQRRWPADGFVVETNVFQELLATQIATVSRARGIMLPVVPIVNTTKKEVRIRRLGPFLAHGGIRFRNTPGTRVLVQQLRDFPEGEFDDGPDALEMALRVMIEMYNGRQQNRQKRGYRP